MHNAATANAFIMNLAGCLASRKQGGGSRTLGVN